jgi:hypothetical protein
MLQFEKEIGLHMRRTCRRRICERNASKRDHASDGPEPDVIKERWFSVEDSHLTQGDIFIIYTIRIIGKSEIIPVTDRRGP